jgi:putative methionine-R-sulfoxide reductase with GAF domain
VACQTIAFGRGVCGAAAKTGITQVVPDVEKFPGHIACDSESRSEIVVPILKDGEVSGSAQRMWWMKSDMGNRLWPLSMSIVLW